MPNIRPRRPHARHLTRLAIMACGIATLAGCGGSDDDAVAPSYAQRCQLSHAASDTLELPAPTGRHCIGKSSFQLLDTSRAETNTPDLADRRELSVKVWFPADATGTADTRASYVDPAIQPLLSAQFGIAADAPEVLTNVRLNATPHPGAPYPVLIFSPGYGGIADIHSALLEDLASHGFVVVAIDHPYTSGVTRLASGELALARTLPTDLAETTAFLEAALTTLVSDQRQVLDWLKSDGIGPLGKHLDLARIGVFGHSFGGATALQTLRQDERVAAGIDLDGRMFGDLSSPWRKPLMFLLNESHTDHPGIDEVLRTATGPHHSLSLKGFGHADFADLKLLLNFYVPDRTDPVWATMDLGPIDAASAVRTTREQTLAFFQQHLAK